MYLDKMIGLGWKPIYHENDILFNRLHCPNHGIKFTKDNIIVYQNYKSMKTDADKWHITSEWRITKLIKGAYTKAIHLTNSIENIVNGKINL